MATELRLLRTAVLYADSVDLISLRADALSGVQELHAAKDGEQFLTALGAMDYDTWVTLGGNAREMDRERWPAFAQFLRERETFMNHARSQLDQLDIVARRQVEEGLAQIEKSAELAHQLVPQMRANLEEQAKATGFAELAPFLSSRRIRLDQVAGLGDDGNAVATTLLARLSEIAVDSERFLLTNEAVSGVIDSLVRSGHLRIPQVAGARAREAQVNAGLVQRMPILLDAPLEHVWDIREELSSELGRYRAEVRALARAIESPAYAPGLAAEVEEQWIRDVQPALADVEKAMKTSQRIKRAAAIFSKSAGATATGQGAVGSVAYGYFGWMPDPASLAVSGGGTVVKAVADVVADQWRNRATKQMRFYYLGEANRRAAKCTDRGR